MTDPRKIGRGPGKLHVVDRQGERVATFEWKGSLWKGTGLWTWFSSEQVEKQIDNAVALGKKEYAGASVGDMNQNAVQVPIWQGFSGVFGGLVLALPVFGYEVDHDSVEWPGGVIEDYEELYLL